ncbi:MAG TPA: hypothetical protein VFS97_05750, partial [Nitrososphaeraceae archaeon]|nr:hypothetical protein [Nitrososphaeraceae archaeon]
KLSTTVRKIDLVPNHRNAALLREFSHYIGKITKPPVCFCLPKETYHILLSSITITLYAKFPT